MNLPEDEYAEYAAYLKKRTYDGLLSISYGINQETQARRYAMVLAELAEREKRGETGGEKGDEKTDPKSFASFLAIAVGLFFAIAGLVAVLTGSHYTRNFHQVMAAEKPVTFWYLVGQDFVAAAICLYVGFRNFRNKK